MKFILNFDMNGAAFDEGNAAMETARILRKVAAEIESGFDVPGHFQTVRDVNGNRVGQYAAKPDDYSAGSY